MPKTATKTLSSYFTAIKRGVNKGQYTLADKAPEYLRDAVYAAHQGALPNGWHYLACHSALLDIEAGNLTEDSTAEWADGEVAVYTKALWQWATDHYHTVGFSEGEEYLSETGMGHEMSTEKRLQVIQYHVLEQIAYAMIQAASQHTVMQEQGK